MLRCKLTPNLELCCLFGILYLPLHLKIERMKDVRWTYFLVHGPKWVQNPCLDRDRQCIWLPFWVRRIPLGGLQTVTSVSSSGMLCVMEVLRRDALRGCRWVDVQRIRVPLSLSRSPIPHCSIFLLSAVRHSHALPHHQRILSTCIIWKTG